MGASLALNRGLLLKCEVCMGMCVCEHVYARVCVYEHVCMSVSMCTREHECVFEHVCKHARVSMDM